MSAVDRADGLESELEKILQSDDQLKALAGEMGIGGGAAGGEGSNEEKPQ